MDSLTLNQEIIRIKQYLWPDRLPSKIIIILLFTLFIVWLYKLIKHCKEVKRCHRQLLQFENVDDLVSLLPTLSYIQDETAESIFTSFISDKKVSAKSAVIGHLKAIYMPGYKQSRFDPNTLINHTLHELFPGVQVLKGVLSTFIIIGLLGTLIGIADSFSSTMPDNATKEQIISALTSTMRTAFAPSIIGVLMTIIGVYLYIYYYNHKSCKPLRDDLERLTINVWLPVLYPTSSERIRDITKENLKVVESVAGFANDIHKNIDEFKDKTSEATKIITVLAQAIKIVNNAAIKIDSSLSSNIELFATNVNKLTSFQSELTNLYVTLSEDTKFFRLHVKQTLEEQNKWFPDLLTTLKSYEYAYIQGRDKQEEDMRKLIAEATSGFESLSSKNLEKINAVNSTLEKNLSHLHDSLSSNLSEFSKTLNSFVPPVENAAVDMSRTFQNLVKTVEDIIRDLNVTISNVIDKKIPSDNPEIIATLKSLLALMEKINTNMSIKQINTTEGGNQSLQLDTTDVINAADSKGTNLQVSPPLNPTVSITNVKPPAVRADTTASQYASMSAEIHALKQETQKQTEVLNKLLITLKENPLKRLFGRN